MMKLYTYEGNYRAWKTLIAGRYNGVEIEVPEFRLHEDNTTEEFLAKNPLGKVPVLETPEGCIFESNAIARYVARLRRDTSLYGRSFFESALVDQWVDFAANEVEPARAMWLFPVQGFMQFDQEAYDAARADMMKALHLLDARLESCEYLVGAQVTLADIVVVCALVDLFRLVFDEGVRSEFPSVVRWFSDLVARPQFSAVIGEVTLAPHEQLPPRRHADGRPKKEQQK